MSAGTVSVEGGGEGFYWLGGCGLEVALPGIGWLGCRNWRGGMVEYREKGSGNVTDVPDALA